MVAVGVRERKAVLWCCEHRNRVPLWYPPPAASFAASLLYAIERVTCPKKRSCHPQPNPQSPQRWSKRRLLLVVGGSPPFRSHILMGEKEKRRGVGAHRGKLEGEIGEANLPSMDGCSNLGGTNNTTTMTAA